MAMAETLYPNPENCSLEELETAMNATPLKQNFRRMQAIRWIFMGFDNPTVAELANIHRDTVTDWIKRFNAQGIDGLIDQPRSGRPRKIPKEKEQDLCQVIENPETAGEVHWTGKKFHGYLRENLGEEIGYSTVMRWLHEKDYRLKVPQPWPDRQSEEERRVFVDRLAKWVSDSDVELWFMDEMGVEGDPRPRRRWAKKGKKARVTRNGTHMRMNVTGMICPRTGEAFMLEFTHNDRQVFQTFLDEANKTVKLDRQRNLLICDNASWHKCKTLEWGDFEPVYLPAYSPDLNPIEKLWLVIKAEWFADFVARTKNELIDRLDNALRWVMDRKTDNTKTCSVKVKL
jgi:transposase